MFHLATFQFSMALLKVLAKANMSLLIEANEIPSANALVELVSIVTHASHCTDYTEFPLVVAGSC
jgi:hypothetical protein